MRTLIFLLLTILLSLNIYCMPNLLSKDAISHIGWGGGGAFTSVVSYNNKTYLSSDVAGVWYLDNKQWIPDVTGLGDYNVTRLIAHHDMLLAITKTSIYYKNKNSIWNSTGIEASTFRNTSKQLVAISDNGTLCVATLKPLIFCFNKLGVMHKVTLDLKGLHGVYFRKGDTNNLLAFLDNQLYEVNIETSKQTLIKTFKHDVVSIARLNEGIEIVATRKKVFLIDNLDQSIPINSRSEIRKIIPSPDLSNLPDMIVTGKKWAATYSDMQVSNQSINIDSEYSFQLDLSLPYRSNQKSITEPISYYWHNNLLWITDYWGVYRQNGVKSFEEVSSNAKNVVSTDLQIVQDKLVFATMDNGLIVYSKQDSKSRYTQVFPTSYKDKNLQGHFWSIHKSKGKVYAPLSPWNDPKDYLVQFDEHMNYEAITKITDHTDRRSNGAFWGRAYTRNLVISDDIYGYRDGQDGGLTRIKSAPNLLFRNFDTIFSEGQNRVYYAILDGKTSISAYKCGDNPSLNVISKTDGKLVSRIDGPPNFCGFFAYADEDTSFFYGNQNIPTIYKFQNNKFVKYFEHPVGSTFSAFKTAPSDRNIKLISTRSWSNKPLGQLLITVDDGKNWKNISCILTNQTGVVDIEFTPDNLYVYLLQHIGGAIKVKWTSILAMHRCKFGDDIILH